jgi:hypothetical protein
MEAIKIGFTGNRKGLTPIQEEEIKLILDKYDNIIVSHGDCIGSDTDFHNLCMNYKNTHINKNITICIFPPNDPKSRAFNIGDLLMKEEPYLKRNLNIIKNCSILIACPVDKNREDLRSETWSTVRKARKHNLLIYLL